MPLSPADLSPAVVARSSGPPLPPTHQHDPMHPSPRPHPRGNSVSTRLRFPNATAHHAAASPATSIPAHVSALSATVAALTAGLPSHHSRVRRVQSRSPAQHQPAAFSAASAVPGTTRIAPARAPVTPAPAPGPAATTAACAPGAALPHSCDYRRPRLCAVRRRLAPSVATGIASASAQRRASPCTTRRRRQPRHQLTFGGSKDNANSCGRVLECAAVIAVVVNWVFLFFFLSLAFFFSFPPPISAFTASPRGQSQTARARPPAVVAPIVAGTWAFPWQTPHLLSVPARLATVVRSYRQHTAAPGPGRMATR
jgi:hypothetical protein